MPRHGTPTISPRTSTPDILFLVLLVSFAAAGVIAINDLSIYTPDSTRYLVWARSLALFDGYRDATLPDPIRYVVHAPLYPLLLAPVALFFPLNVVAAKIWTAVFALFALTFFYRWSCPRIGRIPALLGCFFLAVNPLYLLFSTEVLSDIPFAAVVLLLFVLMEKYTASENPSRAVLFSLSLTIAAGVLLREIGLAFLFGTMLFLIVRKRWRHAVRIGMIPILAYLAWYFRNEIIIAGFESPSLTNARLMTHHFFTSPADTLLQEMIARIGVNVAVYGRGIGQLIFFPFHSWLQFDVVFLNQQPLSAVNAILDLLRYPLMMMSCGMILYGLVLDLKSSGAGLFRLLVLAFYLGIILLYPLNDIRFLVPFLLLAIYWFVGALSALGERLAGRWRAALSGGVALLMLPNLIWDAQFVNNCSVYNASPLAFYDLTKELKKYPSHFTKPFRLAGDWLKEHTDSSAVVLTQWKDLTAWAGGRKVYATDQTVPLDEFESIIRDYAITHLVSVVQKSGAREFDVQMHLTRRFGFSLVQRIANVEVYSVSQQPDVSMRTDSGTLFRHGISLLRHGRYAEAATILDEGRRSDSLNLPLAFYSAVAKEFAMMLDDASAQFSAIAALPQSLMYAEEAAVHRQIIRRLADAPRMSSPSACADEYFRAGGSCWSLGYRFRARELLRQSLMQDSAYFPALILGIHFALVEGDTNEARLYLARAASFQHDNPITTTVTRLFMEFDSLKRSDRSRHYAALSSLYSSLRITESAIDNALLAVGENPGSAGAWKSLSELYLQRRRYAPARRALERAASLSPGDRSVRQALDEVLTHF